MIHCRAAAELITGYIDGELTADELAALDEHLAECPECHERVIAERQTKDLVARPRQPAEAPDRLRRRIIDAIFGKARPADSTVPKLAPNARVKPLDPGRPTLSL